MDGYICNSSVGRFCHRGKDVCRDHTQGKGASVNQAMTKHKLTGQIVYDFHQLPTEAQPQLRDSVVALLAKYSKGPKPIRIQLSVALANIALQFLAWKDVLSFVVTRLGSDSDSIACLLDFLHVLPEEVNEGRKINLSVRFVA